MARSRFSCYCILCALLGAVLTWLMLFGTVNVSQAGEKKGPVSFINDVAPILRENCFACHDAKKRKGKLELTSYASLRQGGTKEDPVTPGKAKESLLAEVLQATGAERMPPKDAGEALSPEKVAVIARWIDEGAKLDDGIDPKSPILRELRVRWQPPAPPGAYKFPVVINALAFTPDGKRLVVGGNHELTVWDATSGKLLRRVFTRAERAHAMLFLPDGKLAVAGGRPGQEGDVRVYDLDAGQVKDHGGSPAVDGVHDKAVLVRDLLQTDDSMLALALSPDGKKLAAGGCDRAIRVFDLTTGQLDQTIENHADWILGLAFTPDGKGLGSASRDKTAKVWDLQAKESLVTFSEHQNIVYAIAPAPDGKHMFSAGEDNQVRWWPLVIATDEKKRENPKTLGGHGKAVFRLAFHPDDKTPQLASASADGTVRTWNVQAQSGLKSFNGLTDWVYAVALSPDGQLVAGGAANGEVRIWKTADNSLVTTFNATPGYTPPPMAKK